MLIGEVARRSGVSARMLRHYESLGLVRPTGRTVGGYREYSGEDIRRIFHIESLRSLGLSLRDVRRALDDPAFAPAELLAELIRRTRERIVAEAGLLTRLHRTGAAGPADWAEVLQVVALLHALGSDSAGRRQRAALAAGERSEAAVEALVEAVLTESDANVAGALRWALAQAGADAAALLADRLGAPASEIRQRAVVALAAMPGDAAVSWLRPALAHPDAVVRRHAALALGPRGETAAIPALIDLVVAGTNDVEAADALAVVARDPAAATRIVAHLAALLETPADSGQLAAGAGARCRLTQALADLPGDAATQVLSGLVEDADRAVAVTAAHLLRLRG